MARLGASSETPTFYDLRYGIDVGGQVDRGDIHRALYNLTVAVMAICDKIDADSGTPGTDYDTDIGTDLIAAMAKMHIPGSGPVR